MLLTQSFSLRFPRIVLFCCEVCMMGGLSDPEICLPIEVEVEVA